jgi:MFS family permease
VRAYLDLLRMPGILRITAAQLTARIPLGMLSLAILLHVEAQSGSYALAGGVVALVSVGEAIAMPITSRLTGPLGAWPTLLAAAGLHCAALLLLVVVPAEPWAMLALGVLIGASVPPLMPVVRALYPRLVPGDRLPALFALDTTAQELIWIIGPVVATLLAAGVSTSASLIASAVITVLGAVWFVSSPLLADVVLPRSSAVFGKSLLHGTVALAMVASFLLVASFMALEVGIVAHFDGAGVLAGVAIAVSSVGSLVGGLALGHRRLGLAGVVGSLCIVAVGTGLAGVSGDLWLILLALFLSGLGFAPALAAIYVMVSAVVREDAATEVFGFLNTASLVGGALGTALAGVLSESAGPTGAFAAATVLAVAAALSPAVARLAGPVAGLTAVKDAG